MFGHPEQVPTAEETDSRRESQELVVQDEFWISRPNGILPTVNISQLSVREIILPTSLMAGIDLQWRRLPSPARGRSTHATAISAPADSEYNR